MTELFTPSRRVALGALVGASVLPFALSRPAFAQDTPAEYIPLMLEAGLFTKTASEIALEKAAGDLVKQFATLEIGEIEAVEAVLKPLADAPPTEVDGQEAEMLAKLREMAAGPEFDMAYVDAQIVAHQEALGIQQPMSGMAEITVPVATAKLAEESIKSHLAMLNLIKSSMA